MPFTSIIVTPFTQKERKLYQKHWGFWCILDEVWFLTLLAFEFNCHVLFHEPKVLLPAKLSIEGEDRSVGFWNEFQVFANELNSIPGVSKSFTMLRGGVLMACKGGGFLQVGSGPARRSVWSKGPASITAWRSFPCCGNTFPLERQSITAFPTSEEEAGFSQETKGGDGETLKSWTKRWLRYPKSCESTTLMFENSGEETVASKKESTGEETCEKLFDSVMLEFALVAGSIMRLSGWTSRNTFLKSFEVEGMSLFTSFWSWSLASSLSL